MIDANDNTMLRLRQPIRSGICDFLQISLLNKPIRIMITGIEKHGRLVAQSCKDGAVVVTVCGPITTHQTSNMTF
jgi:hypothetical protein